MTIEEFNGLNEETKRILLFEADKVSECTNDFEKFELFYIKDFFIETKTSIRYKFKRCIETYTLNTLPLMYSAEVQLRLI